MSEWRVGSWFANALLCLIHLLEARPLFIQRAKLYLNPRSEPTIPTQTVSWEAVVLSGRGFITPWRVILSEGHVEEWWTV